MKFSFALASALLASGGIGSADGRALSTSGTPVERVVNLLQDLKTQLREDKDKEQAVYDKYACWCEQTTERKAGAIEDAKVELKSLGSQILELTAKVSTLSSEIEQNTKDSTDNEKAQQELTSIRSKENRAYMAEAAEIKQAISALEHALIVLQGSAGASLLQRGAAAASTGRAIDALQDAISSVPGNTLAKLEKKGKTAAARLALLRNSAEGLSKGNAHYAPQAATITGILDEMYKTFAEDSQHADEAEADANKGYEGLTATKQEELILLQEALQKAEKDKAESEQMLAEATQAYDDTEEQLKTDIEFFDKTKEGCTNKADEWQTRTTLRAEEVEGISKALEILTSDAARELFATAIQPGIGFLQVSSLEASMAPVVKKAYEALKAQAAATHSLKLARVAADLRLAKAGHFDEVIASIDTWIGKLKDEAQADIEKRDQCLQEYQKINSTMADLSWKVEVNDATIGKLEALIKKLEEEKEQTIKEIDATSEQIADMKAERTAENEAFLQAKKADEDSIGLLTQATEFLSAYFTKNKIELGPLQNFLQQGPEFERSPDDAPDAVFSDKGKRKGESKGIVAILATIIEDLGSEISNAVKAEAAALELFEENLKIAEELLLNLQTKKTNLETAIANRKTDKTAEEEKKTKNEADLADEEKYLKDITPDCDFVINSFDSRAKKRTAEMDGLRHAKELLSGYQASASLLSSGRPLLAKGGLRSVAQHS